MDALNFRFALFQDTPEIRTQFFVNPLGAQRTANHGSGQTAGEYHRQRFAQGGELPGDTTRHRQTARQRADGNSANDPEIARP